MNTVKLCLLKWNETCYTHYIKYDLENIANAVCNVPYKLLEQMLSGFWQRQCTSGGTCYGTDYYDNIPFNIIGYRQMADKATDTALLPKVCSSIECIVSEIYLKTNLSSCNHGAYANDADMLEGNYTLLIIILVAIIMLF